MSKTEPDILSLAREGILKAGGLDHSRRVGVALSGGADSVALLSLLVSLGYRCVALHCNFHLRGDESDRDELFVRELTDRMGVQSEVAQMDVAARRKSTSESVEMACRELRYRWFDEMAHKHDLQAVAVAHHRNDQVETFFLNLLRGAGVRGLAAMKPRNGLIIRPLLEITRKELTDYLDSKGLPHITDSTNACDDFKRNRLRNRLIPLLEELFPGASDSISRSIGNLRRQATLLDENTDRLRSRYVGDGDIIDLQRVMDCERHPSEALYEIMTLWGFNASVTDDIIASSDKTGAVFNGKERSFILERGKLSPHDAEVVRPGGVFAHPSEIPGISVEIIERTALTTLKCDKNMLLLDAEAVSGEHRWELRQWCEGDRMAPYGMDGSRLVSDIFTDAKMSFAERQQQPVVTVDGVIVWLPGVRASRHYAVTARTATVMRVVWNGE